MPYGSRSLGFKSHDLATAKVFSKVKGKEEEEPKVDIPGPSTAHVAYMATQPSPAAKVKDRETPILDFVATPFGKISIVAGVVFLAYMFLTG